MIIGLCGRKGCGKSSVAKAGEPYGYNTMSFADPLRDMLNALGIPKDMLNDPKLKESGTNWVFGYKTPRQLLQSLGTAWGRECVSQTIWIDHLIERFRGDGMDNVIIDDVRFNNEAEAIQEEGGVIVEVVRDESFYADRDPHPSEQGIAEHLIDYQFKNVSCYENDLVLAVEALIHKLEVGRMSNVY